MAIPNRVQADFGLELSINAATFTGANQSIGSFVQAPSLIIIQNDTNVTVSLHRFSVPAEVGISFVAGTKIVLDMCTNRAIAEFFSFPANTPIFVSAAAGVGSFKIAYIYGKA